MSETQRLHSNVLVVVRSIGERTAAACCRQLARQVPQEHIVVVENLPFSQAVRRTFELGLEHALPWTLAVDADVLAAPGAVQTYLDAAAAAPGDVFELECRLFDKLFGGPRDVGMHLYRTELFERARQFAEANDEVHRPESHVVRQMQAAGYPQQLHDFVLGLHDFEQSYRDLYRKGFVHAQKWGDQLRFFEPLWRRRSEDADFAAVLLGLQAGRACGGIARTDATAFDESVDRTLAEHGLAEKAPLSAEDLGAADVADMLRGLEPTDEYRAWEQWRKRRARRARFRRALSRIAGPIRTTLKRWGS